MGEHAGRGAAYGRANAETTPRCECCAVAPATEWHPDEDGETWGYCAPCVQALMEEDEHDG